MTKCFDAGRLAVLGATVLLMARAAPAQPRPEQALERRALERRSVDAAIWGMPLVSFDAMRQAYLRDANAQYGDVLYFSKAADAKFQVATPNASFPYVYFNFNTKDGPIVLDFPAAVGAGLFGSLNDAWHAPLADVGPAGEDHGRGGAYLILPPEYKGGIPARLFPVRSKTYNGYALFRVIPAGPTPADLARAVELVKKIRVYPLSQAKTPPQQRFIDMAGRPFDGIARYDDTFYDSLARMVQEEPVQTRDLVAMAALRSLGIEKGKDFLPDPSVRPLLKKAIGEAHATFMQRAAGSVPFWPGSRWGTPPAVGPATGFSFETASHLEIEERAATFFLSFAPAKKLGAASLELSGFADAKGRPLRGDITYRLRVPARVPIKQFWSVTAYDLTTASFFRESPRPALGSDDQALVTNSDGSVDVYFGPKAPPGKTANWVYTAPAKPWFTIVRFYGPGAALLDKSWTLPDILPGAG